MNYCETIKEPLNEVDFWQKLEENDENRIFKWTGKEDLSDFNQDYLDLLLQYNENMTGVSEIEEGQIVRGVIHEISRREIVINCNYKDYVYVDNKVSDLKIIKNLKPGDEIDVFITQIIDRPYQIKGSITELIRMNVISKLKDFFKENTPLTGSITEKIAAGFMLDIEIDNIIINAFMPNTLAAPNKLTDKQAENLVGQNITVCLESLQQERGVYVVSRKKYLLKHILPEALKKLKRNETRYIGHVTGTTKYGVFVQFAPDEDSPECLTGMIHQANLNPEHKIEDVKPGMTIAFFVKDVTKKGKIILTQVIRESVWDKIRVGQTYEAKVSSVKNFGVLVALDEETFGLIQNFYLEKTNRSLKKGEKVKVKVISVIRDERKIYLDFDKKDSHDKEE
jgi:ribosomal protein S1